MSDWQPIDTVPKNGSQFLGFEWSAERQAGAFVLARWSDMYDEFEDEYGSGVDRLTHWMPLPKPPVAA